MLFSVSSVFVTPAHHSLHQKPRECPELPKAVVNHSQNLHLRAPNFTAIDSPNDDDHQNANLGLAVDTQAYPLARTPVHHSLYISAPAVSSEMDCLPQPANGDQMTESNMMEGVISENGRAILTPTSRLSSLAGGAVVNMGSEEQSSDAKEMVYYPPHSFSSAFGNDPMLSMQS